MSSAEVVAAADRAPVRAAGDDRDLRVPGCTLDGGRVTTLRKTETKGSVIFDVAVA